MWCSVYLYNSWTMKDLSQDIYIYIFLQVCVDIKKDKVPTIL